MALSRHLTVARRGDNEQRGGLAADSGSGPPDSCRSSLPGSRRTSDERARLERCGHSAPGLEAEAVPGRWANSAAGRTGLQSQGVRSVVSRGGSEPMCLQGDCRAVVALHIVVLHRGCLAVDQRREVSPEGKLAQRGCAGSATFIRRSSSRGTYVPPSEPLRSDDLRLHRHHCRIDMSWLRSRRPLVPLLDPKTAWPRSNPMRT